MNTLTISNTPINQDAEGRYCLNDLHRAAGDNPKHQPSNFLRLDNTKALIDEVDSSSDLRSIKAVEIIQGKGKEQGTYVVKELVYAYAMWISPAFSLKVIRAYDALVTGGYSDLAYQTLQSKYIGLLEEKLSRLVSAAPLQRYKKFRSDEIAAALRCKAEGYCYRDTGELLGRTRESIEHMVRKAEGRGRSLYVAGVKGARHAH